eukprot:COSAG02_NODE_4396_length_5408_cov_13.262938_1_plen_184_part_00
MLASRRMGALGLPIRLVVCRLGRDATNEFRSSYANCAAALSCARNLAGRPASEHLAHPSNRYSTARMDCCCCCCCCPDTVAPTAVAWAAGCSGTSERSTSNVTPNALLSLSCRLAGLSCASSYKGKCHNASTALGWAETRSDVLPSSNVSRRDSLSFFMSAAAAVHIFVAPLPSLNCVASGGA